LFVPPREESAGERNALGMVRLESAGKLQRQRSMLLEPVNGVMQVSDEGGGAAQRYPRERGVDQRRESAGWMDFHAAGIVEKPESDGASLRNVMGLHGGRVQELVQEISGAFEAMVDHRVDGHGHGRDPLDVVGNTAGEDVVSNV